MKQMSLIKRGLFYILLSGLSLLGLLFGAFFGGREYGTNYLILCIYLIPQYIFGFIFLQAKWIIKVFVPMVTAIVSYGSLLLIVKIGLFDMIVSIVLLYCVLCIPIIFIWEITYQVLIKITSAPETEHKTE
jgi:hypothetical protein